VAVEMTLSTPNAIYYTNLSMENAQSKKANCCFESKRIIEAPFQRRQPYN
jgi:hypothetical protein